MAELDKKVPQDYSPSEQLAYRFNYFLAAWDTERYAIPAAFEMLRALARRGRSEVGETTRDNSRLTPVPHWVVDTLSGGWLNYLEHNLTFGRAFRVEEFGQGKQPARRNFPQLIKNCWLVLLVEEHREATGASLEKCFDAVAEAEELIDKNGDWASETVRNAWRGRTSGDVRKMITEMRKFWGVTS